MRVIKFRGQRTETKEWICGDLAYIYNRIPCIMPEWCMSSVPDDEEMKRNKEMLLGGFMEVIPETVGQFTGLHDKLGNEVYEGDLLSRNTGLTYQVYWNNNESDFNMKNILWADDDCPMNFYNVEGRFEVVGNIHDDSELVK